MTQDDLNNVILLANHGVARLTASANGVFAEIQAQINFQAEAAAKAAVEVAPPVDNKHVAEGAEQFPDSEAPTAETVLERTQGD